MEDFYKILEIPPTATVNEIKKAYRRLALKYHPDRNFGNKTAENKFIEIHEAYRILSDPIKRKEYDTEKTNTQTEGTLTPDIVLNTIQNIRKRVTFIRRKRIDQEVLYQSLNKLFFISHIDLLLSIGDELTNKKIIQEALTCCKKLDFSYVKKITPLLAKLAGSDNVTIQKIFSFTRRQRYLNYWHNYASLTFIVATILIPFIISKSNINSSSSYYNRPRSGDLFLNSNDSSKSEYSTNQDSLATGKPDNNYSFWDKTNYTTGSVPGCFNFRPKYNKSLDNELEVNVGENTDVVIKLCNLYTKECIRYVYIRGGDTYDIKNIPEGKYYLKIAYGQDWRQKVTKGKCVGKFTQDATYEEGTEILDFHKIYLGKTIEGDQIVTHYKLPSYSLELYVSTTDFQGQFQTNSISEEEFNE